MSLVGNTFYQNSSVDPGSGYPMYFWAQLNTGLIYVRAPDDSGWNLVGDTAQPYLGQLSTQGGNVNGAITGAHGLSPADSNDFTASLYERGLEVATLDYVNTQVSILEAAISVAIQQAVSNIPTLNLGTRVAKASDIWTATSATTTTGFTIPLPLYSDSVQALASECTWGAAIVGIRFGTTDGHNTVLQVVESPIGSRAYTLQGNDDHSAPDTINVLWWITGFRSQT